MAFQADVEKLTSLMPQALSAAMSCAAILLSPFLRAYTERNDVTGDVDWRRLISDLSEGKAPSRLQCQNFVQNFHLIMFDSDCFTGWADEFTQGALLGTLNYLIYLVQGASKERQNESCREVAAAVVNLLMILEWDYASRVPVSDASQVVCSVAAGDIKHCRFLAEAFYAAFYLE